MAPVRDHLLAAAREEFLAHGYRKAGVAAVAKRAGMAAGSVYAFFPSKKDLFVEVYMAENAASKAAIAADIDWTDPRTAVFTYVSANIAAQRKNAILAEWSGETIGPTLHERFAANGMSGAVWDFLLQQVQRWRDEGRFAHDATVELVDELLTAVNLIDASGLVSARTQQFMIEAVLDRIFVG